MRSERQHARWFPNSTILLFALKNDRKLLAVKISVAKNVTYSMA